MKKVKDFLCREIAGEYILIPTGNTTEKFNGMITLTETAAFIYNHIEEAKTFEVPAEDGAAQPVQPEPEEDDEDFDFDEFDVDAGELENMYE
mgnify:CR=1 FL=1